MLPFAPDFAVPMPPIWPVKRSLANVNRMVAEWDKPVVEEGDSERPFWGEAAVRGNELYPKEGHFPTNHRVR